MGLGSVRRVGMVLGTVWWQSWEVMQQDGLEASGDG